MYIPREIESVLQAYRRQFKVTLVTGARQVGKTTMLRHVMPEVEYTTLDDPRELSLATHDEALFFRGHGLPLVVDEVQRVPGLFRYVKYLVDQTPDKGQVVLTGSQTYHLMQEVSESLAGRVGILELSSLSLREILRIAARGKYLPGKPYDAAAETVDVWQCMWRGTMPELQDPDLDWHAFYSAYERSYLERDVRALLSVRDEERFFRFMIACAARTGQLLNASNMAADVGVDVKTIQSWVSVLQASGLIHLVHPFFSNATKRVSKTPKLYFMDTGLVCHLLGWTTPTTLERGAMSGPIFETFVVSEIIKSHLNSGGDVRQIFFYRDSAKREIDVVIRDGRTLHPVEIKRAATPGREAIRHFSALATFRDFEVGSGAVICQTDRAFPLADDTMAVPITAI